MRYSEPRRSKYLTPGLPLLPSVGAGVIVFVCFTASIWILRRHAPPGIVDAPQPKPAITVLPFEPERLTVARDAFIAD